ncbi:hypothetical protein [Laspinema sp. D2d]|nr:hypothetical protein [Laspinema sp. D2d]
MRITAGTDRLGIELRSLAGSRIHRLDSVGKQLIRVSTDRRWN